MRGHRARAGDLLARVDGERRALPAYAADVDAVAACVLSSLIGDDDGLRVEVDFGRGPSLSDDGPRAQQGILALKPQRLVYVSCDVATLARDARRFVEAGYGMEHVEAFDLFPNTAHVETLVVFVKRN